jgi:hypothetical protein
MRLIKLLAVFAALTVVAAPAAWAQSIGPTVPSERNFVAFLSPVAAGPGGFGLVLFRQPEDGLKIVYLDVWVAGLAPSHSYYLQRATDSTVDDNCTGTNWLTLGQGLVPQAITTDALGTGRASLFRDLDPPGPLTGPPPGTRSDIHFRVIDAVTEAEVLKSGCYQFVVIQ